MKPILIILLTLILISCGSQWGTNTGNPDNASPSTPDSVTSPYLSPITRLTESICEKIRVCSLVVNSTNCTNSVRAATGFTDELTLNPPFTTLQAVDAAYFGGSIQFNETNLTTCETAVGQLTCSDPLVVSAFSAATPSDFTKLHILFRASDICQSLKK